MANIILEEKIYIKLFIYLTPSPPQHCLYFFSELWSVILGLILFGLSIGCAIVPTFQCLVIGAQDLGFEDNLDTFGLVSGLFNSFFCLGAFCGPSLGGTMVDQLGFAWASTVMTGVFWIITLTVFTYFVLRHFRHKSQTGSHTVTYAQGLPGADSGILVDPSVVVERLSTSISQKRTSHKSRQEKWTNPASMRSLSNLSV